MAIFVPATTPLTDRTPHRRCPGKTRRQSPRYCRGLPLVERRRTPFRYARERNLGYGMVPTGRQVNTPGLRTAGALGRREPRAAAEGPQLMLTSAGKLLGMGRSCFRVCWSLRFSRAWSFFACSCPCCLRLRPLDAETCLGQLDTDTRCHSTARQNVPARERNVIPVGVVGGLVGAGAHGTKSGRSGTKHQATSRP
jgi:hypothetical protein